VAFSERRFADALSLFTRSVRIVEAQRRQITSTDARALLLALHSTPHAGLLRTYVALNDFPAAFATLERSRARSLVDLLAERRLDFRADAPIELLTQQEELDQKRSVAYIALTEGFTKLTEARRAISKLDPTKERNRITIIEASRQTQEKRLRELREDLVTIAVQQRDLDTQIRRASPKLAALQYPEPLDLHAAQTALDSGTLLLTYVVDEEATYLFAVTKSDFQLFALPVGRARLVEQVRLFRAVVAKERLGNAAEPGQQLYDTIVRPAQALVNRAQRVLICPEGPLQALPFAALVSRPDPQLRYFIDDRPLHMISSMTVYAETRKRAAERQRATRGSTRAVTLLAFGDPLYTKAQAAAGTGGTSEAENKTVTPRGNEAASPQQRGINLAPLPRTRDEVQTIVGLFGNSARAKLGSEATETAAKRESKDVGILHFASHGWID
jgi:CHAT domain-containing protein